MNTCTTRGVVRVTLNKKIKAHPLEPTAKRTKKCKNTDRSPEVAPDWEA